MYDENYKTKKLLRRCNMGLYGPRDASNNHLYNILMDKDYVGWVMRKR